MTSSQDISRRQSDRALQQRGERTVRWDGVADLEGPTEREAGQPDSDGAGHRIDRRRCGEWPRQDARLLEVVDAVGEDTCGDDDQADARDREEHTEVDANHAAVDDEPEHDGDQQAGQRAGEGIRSTAERANHRPEEQCRFDALPGDRDEADQDDAPQAARRERSGHPLFELAAQTTRGALHPEDHAGDQRDREDRQGPADDLLCFEAQRVRAKGQDEPETERQADGEADAQPQAGQDVTSLGTDEERDEDPDDQCGLETLAQADDEGGEHGKTATFR